MKRILSPMMLLMAGLMLGALATACDVGDVSSDETTDTLGLVAPGCQVGVPHVNYRSIYWPVYPVEASKLFSNVTASGSCDALVPQDCYTWLGSVGATDNEVFYHNAYSGQWVCSGEVPGTVQPGWNY
jgi:hypothetical protein